MIGVYLFVSKVYKYSISSGVKKGQERPPVRLGPHNLSVGTGSTAQSAV